MVVDGHPMIREGISTALKRGRGISVCALVASATEAIEVAEGVQPDVAIIDFRLSDDSGIEAIKKIHSRWPQIKILVMTVFRDEQLLRKSLAAGARGYVVIDATELTGNGGFNEDLMRAVRAVAAGHEYLDPAVTKFPLDWIRNSPEWIIETSTDARLQRLSPQEKRTFLLMARGMTNRDIAEEMGLSLKTVEGYASFVLAKLRVRRRSEAIAYVRRLSR